MQLLDTPNPNAKKILTDSSIEIQQSIVTDKYPKSGPPYS